MTFIQDIFSWLLTLFVIGPLQAEFEDKLQVATVPPTILQDVQSCIATGAPALIERATNDIWWGVDTTVRVVIGFANAHDVLASATPECGAAMSAVKPFLDSPEV